MEYCHFTRDRKRLEREVAIAESNRNSFSVRVRGIYSTALAKIFLDEGFTLGDLSPKLISRLRINKEDLSTYVDLTVKNDDEYRDIIVFVGFPEAVEKAADILRKYFANSFIEEPKPLYAVYKGVVEKRISHNECLVTSPIGVSGVLRDMLCSPGQELHVTIIGYRNDLETPILKRGISVVGKYMILDDTGRAQFSEHIRDADVIEELKGFTEIITRENFGVKWRSSSKNTDTMKILEELSILKKLYRDTLGQITKSENNRFVYIGERIGFIQLSTKDLEKLDEIRSLIYPTAPLHHALKTFTNLRNIVDLLDLLAEKLSREDYMKSYYKYLIEKIRDNVNVYMIHRRLFYEETISIGPAKVLYADLDSSEDNTLRLILQRYVKSEGVYDGLNIPKQPGDVILTFLKTGHRYIFHVYYDQNYEIKGVYINANTEIYPLYDIDPRSGRENIYLIYNDLIIDGVVGENLKKIIDDDEFTKQCSKKRLREETCMNIRHELNNMIEEGDKLLSLFRDLSKKRSLEDIDSAYIENIFNELYKFEKR